MDREPLTDQQLAEIRKRADAATAGPWVHALGADFWQVRRWLNDQYDSYEHIAICPHGGESNPVRAHNNSRFIAHSRADVPKLLDDDERVRARNKELEDLFHLQQSRMTEAVEFWRKSTGRDDATPSLGDLLAFLLREIEERGKRQLCMPAAVGAEPTPPPPSTPPPANVIAN